MNEIVKGLGNYTRYRLAPGDPQGAGFSWRNITVYKLGLLYDYSQSLTLRIGYDHSDQPIPQDQTLLSILAYPH